MKFTILDAFSINLGDLSWDPISELCDFHPYDRTESHQISDHITGCDGFFVSKCSITRQIMEACPTLKFIGVTATGYDNVDIQAAKDLGIAVCNVPAYSTEAVAQHAFALILELSNRAGRYNESIQRGKWYETKDFTFIEDPLTLLDGKSLGIIGYGNIGKRVARIGEAFGMKINIYSQNKKAAMESDFLTLHCPLTPENKGFVNTNFINQMKDGAILINTARGALINEPNLADALKRGKLAAAAVDVLSCEPPKMPNPLIGLPNCILTPHIAWMPKETRQKVIDICAANLQSWMDGGKLNRIV
ncbi:D-2-hydroxyacid dehydrogenase [Ihubacter sp. mB4P-1]|uniref:D-2-hydroxyacid dehydrogenase n=1 Tax=Ihubacter sp. mB4P-1 TaxID=3242370 RepID=UPI003C7E2A9D